MRSAGHLGRIHGIVAGVPLVYAVAAGASLAGALRAMIASTITVWIGTSIAAVVIRRSVTYPCALSFGILTVGGVHVALPALPHRVAVVVTLSLVLALGASMIAAHRNHWVGTPTDLLDQHMPTHPVTWSALTLVAAALVILGRQNPILLTPACAIGGMWMFRRHTWSAPLAVVGGAAALFMLTPSGRVLAGLNNDQVWDIANATGFSQVGILHSIAQDGVPYSYYKFAHLWLGTIYSIIGIDPLLEGIWLTSTLVAAIGLAAADAIGRIVRHGGLALIALMVGVAIPEPYALDPRHPILISVLLVVVLLELARHLSRELVMPEMIALFMFGFGITGSRSPYAIAAVGALLVASLGTAWPVLFARLATFILGALLGVFVFFRGIIDNSAPLPNTTHLPDPITSLWTLLVVAPWRLAAAVALVAPLTLSTTRRAVRRPAAGAALSSSLAWCFLPRHGTQSDLVWLTILLIGIATLEARQSRRSSEENVASAVATPWFIGTAAAISLLAVARRLAQYSGEFPGMGPLVGPFRPFQPDSWGTVLDIPTALTGAAVIGASCVLLALTQHMRGSWRLAAYALSAGAAIGTSAGYAFVTPIGNLLTGEPLLGPREGPLVATFDVERSSPALSTLRASARSGEVVATSIHEWASRSPNTDGDARLAYLTRLPLYIEAPLYGSPASERLAHGVDPDQDPVVAAWHDRISFSISLGGRLTPQVVAEAAKRGVTWIVRRPATVSSLPPGVRLVARDQYFEVLKVTRNSSG